MSSFRLVVLVVFCVCRIYVTDAALGSCSTGNDNCLGNAICNEGENECVCEPGLVEDDGTDTCVKVLGTCTGGTACAVADTVCNDPNCVCKDGFIDGETDTCVKVLGGSCPASTDCDSVANSECTTDTPVCRCATGHKEENNLCVASELGDTCTTKEDCSTSVTNSECTTDTTVCKCASGYKEENKVCVASVLGGACGSGSACTPDNSECSALDICVCQAGFITGTGTEANTCVKVLGGTCKTNADCISVVNSECDTESCKCTTGYEEKNNVCVASGSGGPRSIPCLLLMASMAIFRFSFM